MKTTILLLCFIIMVSGLKAQQRRYLKSDDPIKGSSIVTGQQGYKVIESWGYGKKAGHAMVDAERRAVLGCIFLGFPGKDNAPKIEPIIPTDKKFEKMETHDSFFNKFFSLTGGWIEYVANHNDVDALVRKVKVKRKGYQVLVNVQVRYDDLRKHLESQGIVENLGDKMTKGTKPIVMIMPKNSYCERTGNFKEIDIQGTKKAIPDFQKLYRKDDNWKQAERKIQELLQVRGFSTISIEHDIEGKDFNDAITNKLQSKDGLTIQENDIDKLLREKKPDIAIEVDFYFNQDGSQRYIHLDMNAIDAYTKESIAPLTGDGKSSFNATVTKQIDEVLLRNIDKFCASLQANFDKIQKQGGRFVNLHVKTWEGFEFNGAPLDLETEFEIDGEYYELTEIIDVWMYKKVIDKQFNRVATQNRILYRNALMPLQIENKLAGESVPATTELFARKLAKYLRRKLKIPAIKVVPLGLGECYVILGQK